MMRGKRKAAGRNWGDEGSYRPAKANFEFCSETFDNVSSGQQYPPGLIEFCSFVRYGRLVGRARTHARGCSESNPKRIDCP